ncbi:MAG: hypothetical protein ABW321_24745, partial [Polyangiales bacterium]
GEPPRPPYGGEAALAAFDSEPTHPPFAGDSLRPSFAEPPRPSFAGRPRPSFVLDPAGPSFPRPVRSAQTWLQDATDKYNALWARKRTAYKRMLREPRMLSYLTAAVVGCVLGVVGLHLVADPRAPLAAPPPDEPPVDFAGMLHHPPVAPPPQTVATNIAAYPAPPVYEGYAAGGSVATMTTASSIRAASQPPAVDELTPSAEPAPTRTGVGSQQPQAATKRNSRASSRLRAAPPAPSRTTLTSQARTRAPRGGAGRADSAAVPGGERTFVGRLEKERVRESASPSYPVSSRPKKPAVEVLDGMNLQ